MAKVGATKDFPSAYPADVVTLLKRMSFTNGKKLVLGGSSSIKAIAYPADYDAVERTSATAKGFKEIIANLLSTKDCYIGDIKCGEKPEWVVIDDDVTVRDGKPYGWKPTVYRERLNALRANGVITPAELKDSLAFVKDTPTPFELLEAKKSIRFNVLRWKPKEVLKGSIILRDGSDYSLEEGVKSKGMMKLDVVGFVSNNRYTDFSIIYDRFGLKDDIVNSLKCDVLYYYQSGDVFKALKRMFALAKYKGNEAFLKKVLPLLNGDLGILYSLKSDCDTLLYLAENEDVLPVEKVRYEIDQFKLRLSHLYEIPSIANRAGTLLGDVEAITKVPSPQLAKRIEAFRNTLNGLLNKETDKVGKAEGVLPPSKEFQP